MYNVGSFTAVGRGLGFIAIGVEQADFASALATGDKLGAADSMVDTGAGLIGFAGPVGFVFSVSYGITDNTFGPALSSKIADMVIYHNEVTQSAFPVKGCTYGLGC